MEIATTEADKENALTQMLDKLTDKADDRVIAVLADVAGGATIGDACSKHQVSPSTIIGLTAKYPRIKDCYELAFQLKLEREAHKLLELADNIDEDAKNAGNHIKKAQLQSNNRMWLLSRLVKRFSDKQQVDVNITCDIGERLRSGIGRVEKEVN